MQFVPQHIIQTARIKLWTHLYSLLVIKAYLKTNKYQTRKKLKYILIIFLTFMPSV